MKNTVTMKFGIDSTRFVLLNSYIVSEMDNELAVSFTYFENGLEQGTAQLSYKFLAVAHRALERLWGISDAESAIEERVDRVIRAHNEAMAAAEKPKRKPARKKKPHLRLVK